MHRKRAFTEWKQTDISTGHATPSLFSDCNFMHTNMALLQNYPYIKIQSFPTGRGGGSFSLKMKHKNGALCIFKITEWNPLNFIHIITEEL